MRVIRDAVREALTRPQTKHPDSKRTLRAKMKAIGRKKIRQVFKERNS
jgi:hypothetical protein